MDEWENSMTLIFNKRTGSIKGIYTGIQIMDVLYGDEAQDYKLIWDAVVQPKDENVINNWQNFRINPDTKGIEILASAIPQYPVASE